jgi:predicted dithiol-disulfide oxidoreductase (DUF899 family)
MTDHTVGSREDWLAARAPLLAREKEYSRLGDELAQQRRELPWVAVEKEYRFDTIGGRRTLAELFEGRGQLVVYHFMFGPTYESGCPACSATADSFNGVLPHLAANDVTMICVSRAPLEKLLNYRERMGWSFNWASSDNSDFNFDYGVSAGAETPHAVAPLLEANELKFLALLKEQPAVRDDAPSVASRNATTSGTNLEGYLSEGHGISTFACEGDSVYHCYSSYARGTEFLMGYYAILDRTPAGRDESAGAMTWLRRHDEYDA